MIYFVDEDINELEPFAIELKNRGYEITILSDADEAFSVLINANDIEAIILDVMLATAEDDKSRYNAVDTNNFATTGLTLLDDLATQYKEKGDDTIPKKVIIFSAAQQGWIVNKIESKSKKHVIEYLDKKTYDDTFTFADKIEEIMKKW